MARVDELVNGLLDRGYTRATTQTLAAIVNNTTNGLMAQRLKELEAEARRLEQSGERLTPDNAILRAVIADAESVGQQNAQILNNTASTLQSSGINAANALTRQLAVGDMSDRDLALLGVRWNIPDPDAVAALVNYSSSVGWLEEMADYGLSVPETLRQIAIRGLVAGQGPFATARQIRDAAEGMPLYRANTTMRTLQLQSYRDATALHQAANADIIEYVIRIGVLDDRICLCCLAEHGKIMEVGERVLDHHNGRCTSVSKIRGILLQVQTGPEWFAAQSPDRQYAIAGPGALNALTTGRADFSDFVTTYDDQVFGEMIREATLTEALK